jgi:hypothetical protein
LGGVAILFDPARGVWAKLLAGVALLAALVSLLAWYEGGSRRRRRRRRGRPRGPAAARRSTWL